MAAASMQRLFQPCVVCLNQTSLTVRTVATSSCLKARTVGVPEWSKATVRRQKTLRKMLKPKSKEQIEAEFNLSNKMDELHFYMTTFKGQVAEENEMPGSSDVEMTMTANKDIFVLYHPPKSYPIQNTKPTDVRPWWHLSASEVDGYADELTPEQKEEVISLRKKDCKIWTINALSHLMKVKPLAIRLVAPLGDKQKHELATEKKVMSEWTGIKKKLYKANQELERLKYIEKQESAKKAIKQHHTDEKEIQDNSSL